MAWYPVKQTVFSGGPVGSVGTGLPLQDGWLDLSGFKLSIGADNLLRTASDSTPWFTARLQRPASENLVDSRVEAVLKYYANESQSFITLRGNTGFLSFTGYLITHTATQMQIFTSVNGTLVNHLGGSFTPPADGTVVKLKAEVVQTTPSTSTLKCGFYTAGDVIIGSEYTYVDSVPELQNVAGAAGVYIYNNGAGTGTFSAISTFTDIPPAPTTTYTVTGPSSGAINSTSTFTVTPNGVGPTSAVVVTPAVVGGGTLSPATVTLAANVVTPQTFTYTPNSLGAKTLSFTNSGTLTNPANITFTANPPATILGVASASARFSPGNWSGDTGRGGSVNRRTWNVGAWCSFTWTAGASPTASLLLSNATSGAMLNLYLNGVLTTDVPANANYAVTGIKPNASNTLKVFVKNMPYGPRWIGVSNSVQVEGLQIDGASTGAAAPAARPWCLYVGDSVSEGQHTQGLNVNSVNTSYSFAILNMLDLLGYDTCLNVSGGTGYIRVGVDVPGYYSVVGGVYSAANSRWNKVDNVNSLLDANGRISAYGATNTEPAIIMVDYTRNDAFDAFPQADFSAAVSGCLNALRGAAPNALIILSISVGVYNAVSSPNGLTYANLLKAAFAAYQTAHPGDGLLALIDHSQETSDMITNGLHTQDTVHPTLLGQATYAPLLLTKVAKAVAKLNNRWTYF